LREGGLSLEYETEDGHDERSHELAHGETFHVRRTRRAAPITAALRMLKRERRIKKKKKKKL
jgi:hypothetical protein